ncbi:MAG: thioredoxin [Pseudomonadota bacterium]
MATKAITDSSFSEDVLNADHPVVVDFWAEWCGPCKQIGPALEEIATEREGTVTIAKMNIDENPDTPGQFGVRGIPTLMIFKGGELVSTKVGAAPKSQIDGWIGEVLDQAGAAAGA